MQKHGVRCQMAVDVGGWLLLAGCELGAMHEPCCTYVRTRCMSVPEEPVSGHSVNRVTERNYTRVVYRWAGLSTFDENTILVVYLVTDLRILARISRLQQLSDPPLLILCHPPSQRRGVHGHVLAADFYGCRRLIRLIWI